MTDKTSEVGSELDQGTVEFYRHSFETLLAADVPFIVGGAYAFARYTGIVRHTKDLDVFLLRDDLYDALEALSRAGYKTEMTSDLWLAKALHGDAFIDLIFSSGNGVAPVDHAWLAHAEDAELFGVRVKLCPPEEMIWQKAYVMERERYDGADVAHLILARGTSFDWDRLLARFADHWQVLLSHLILFRFIYPGQEKVVPDSVISGLVSRFCGAPVKASSNKLCQGTLLSREQFRFDIENAGFLDARLKPVGNVEPEQVDL